jgi:endonuclease YncB( thermonuclease family)
VLHAFQIDPLWYGVIFITALAIGQATPPVGVNLFTAANLIKGEVDSVAKEASSDAPTARPSFSISKAKVAWSAPAYDLSGKVVKVSDGDTITILDPEQQQHKIRLHGIDTPEYKQPYGRAATKALADLVAGEGVGIDVKNTDRYGRTVGVVHKGSANINFQMVRDGYAWWYKKYAPLEDDLRQAEQQARAYILGLWAEPDPIPRWEWRKANR